MKSNRIDKTISLAEQEHRLAFIGLVPIDPSGIKKSREIAHMMVDSGIDIIMVHIPNSMPWMEGQVLQKAAQNARCAGISREEIFDLILNLRKDYPDTPIIDMTLFDTALTMGIDRFWKLSENADVDGFDLPNYPLFSSNDKYGFYQDCLRTNRHLILDCSYEMAVAENGENGNILLNQIAEKGRGFIFVMNAPGGKSGAGKLLSQDQLKNAVTNVKCVLANHHNNQCSVSVVCGISSRDDVKKVKNAGASSFMIGSAYVRMLQDGNSMDSVSTYLKSIRQECYF